MPKGKHPFVEGERVERNPAIYNFSQRGVVDRFMYDRPGVGAKVVGVRVLWDGRPDLGIPPRAQVELPDHIISSP